MTKRPTYYATCIILTGSLLLIGCRKPSRQSGAERSKKPGTRPQIQDPLASGPLPMGIGPSPGGFSLSDAGSPPFTGCATTIALANGSNYA